MNKQNELQLDSGESVRIIRLNQRGTYEVLLEGVPTNRMNRGIIKATMKTANELWGSKAALIEPIETLINLERDSPFGTPASIPQVVCIARLQCLSPANNKSMDYSQLTLVWFQDEFAFPIDEEAIKQILSLKWSKVASDYKY